MKQLCSPDSRFSDKCPLQKIVHFTRSDHLEKVGLYRAFRVQSLEREEVRMYSSSSRRSLEPEELRELADDGDSRAQYKYAMELKKGKRISKNINEAARYFKMAADDGNSDAQYRYGCWLLKGKGVEKDEEEGAFFLKRAANDGDPVSQCRYGCLLAQGRGVTKDLEAAAGYYKMSADQGNAVGQHNYGVCLRYGKGVTKDLEEAARYFRMSADQGDPRGTYSYAVCLETGKGETKDLGEAVRYFKLAMDMGVREAREGYARAIGAGAKSRKRGRKTADKIIFDFSDYREIENLGKGRCGVVTLEEKISTEELFAVKYYQPGLDFNRSLFRMEMDDLLALSHPCIARVVAWSLPGEKGERARVVGQYFKNGTLEHCLRATRAGETPKFWTHTNISKLIVGVILGLRYLHKHGISHRALKPSNIFIGDDDNVCLGDLVSARLEECGAFVSTGVQACQYTAPELFDNQMRPTPSADIFSFGLILYEILVGKGVFPRKLTVLHLARLHAAQHRAPIPKYIHPVIARMIEHCWSPNPKGRPSMERIYEVLVTNWFPFFRDVDVNAVEAYAADVMTFTRGLDPAVDICTYPVMPFPTVE
jgi:TPR repeat protein